MKQKRIYSPVWALVLGIGLAGGACTSEELPDGEQAEVRLQPHFYTGTAETRSIVNGTTSASPATGDKINTVGLYVTRKDDHAVYPGVTGGSQDGYSLFTKNADDNWTGAPEVKLGNIVARIYAFSPSNRTVSAAGGADSHTIPVSIPSEQTFAGGTSGSEGNGWECSGIDYLYGTASQEIGAPSADIEASNTSFAPSVYLHHALAQVVFKLQTVSGRPVDATYDFVKKITLTATNDYFLTGTSGTMQLKDGALGSLTAGKTLAFTPSSAASAVKCGDNTKPATVAYGLVAPMASAPGANSITLTILLGKPAANDGERELTVTIPNPVQWTKGKRYLYTLNLSNRNVTVDATTEITGWDTSTGSNDMKPDGFNG